MVEINTYIYVSMFVRIHALTSSMGYLISVYE